MNASAQHLIEAMPTEYLRPYARNSRTHSDEQVAQIAASIAEYGFTNPLLIDADNQIIAGHGRLLAAMRMGIAEVPCLRLAHLTDSQKRAYIIADNQLAMNAGWDKELLALELGDLQSEEYNLDLLGFTEQELADLAIYDESIAGALPDLPDGEKEPYQQKSFFLHDDQADIVDGALMLARTDPCADTGLNENANANALALICAEWLKARTGDD